VGEAETAGAAGRPGPMDPLTARSPCRAAGRSPGSWPPAPWGS